MPCWIWWRNRCSPHLICLIFDSKLAHLKARSPQVAGFFVLVFVTSLWWLWCGCLYVSNLSKRGWPSKSDWR